jgi:hypothetical protein
MRRLGDLLTKTIKNERRQHTDWLGGQIIGEDPATTLLLEPTNQAK